MKYVFFILICWSVFSGCNNQKDAASIKTYIGATINWDEIKSASENTIESVLVERNNKVVVFIDSANCTPCTLDNVIMWERHENELQKYNLQIILISNVPNQQLIEKYLLNYGINHPLLFDERGYMQKEYPFLALENFQAFVINKENKIIWIGNPLFDEKQWKTFCKVMELREIQDKTL